MRLARSAVLRGWWLDTKCVCTLLCKQSIGNLNNEFEWWISFESGCSTDLKITSGYFACIGRDYERRLRSFSCSIDYWLSLEDYLPVYIKLKFYCIHSLDVYDDVPRMAQPTVRSKLLVLNDRLSTVQLYFIRSRDKNFKADSLWGDPFYIRLKLVSNISKSQLNVNLAIIIMLCNLSVQEPPTEAGKGVRTHTAH